jgi:hypothetical protein
LLIFIFIIILFLEKYIKKVYVYFNIFLIHFPKYGDWGLGIGDWGFGDWGLGPIPNPQSPIPNPQSPL